MVHVHGIMIRVRMELACKHKMPPHPSPVVPDRNRTAAERQSLPLEGKVANAVRRMRWNANQYHSSTVKAQSPPSPGKPGSIVTQAQNKKKRPCNVRLHGLYSGALSGTRTLGPLIKSHRFYAFSSVSRRIKQLHIVYFKGNCGETMACAAWCAVVKK